MSDKAHFHATILQYGNLFGERLNFGIILVCRSKAFIGVKTDSKLKRIGKAFPKASISGIRFFNEALKKGLNEAGYSYEDSTDFYYSIMPKIDSSIILSEPLTGITSNPQLTMDILYNEFVLHNG